MDLETVKSYMKIDFDDDDALIAILLDGAREYLLDAIGGEKLNEDDARIKIALLALISDWYEHREYMGTDTSPQVRYTIRSIVLQFQLGQVTGDED